MARCFLFGLSALLAVTWAGDREAEAAQRGCLGPAPLVLDAVAPKASEIARKARIGGTAEVVVTIDPAGWVVDAQLRSWQGGASRVASQLGLDREALDAARRWRFAPPDASRPCRHATLTFTFINTTDLAWADDRLSVFEPPGRVVTLVASPHLGNAEVRPRLSAGAAPEHDLPRGRVCGASTLAVAQAAVPTILRDLSGDEVRVRLLLDGAGDVAGVSVVGMAEFDPELTRIVTTAAGLWRFRRLAPSPCTEVEVRFVRGGEDSHARLGLSEPLIVTMSMIEERRSSLGPSKLRRNACRRSP